MRFMLFVCAKPDLRLSPKDKAALPGEVEEWATDLADRGIRLMGHVFEPIGQAKAIRRRNAGERASSYSGFPGLSACWWEHA